MMLWDLHKMIFTKIVLCILYDNTEYNAHKYGIVKFTINAHIAQNFELSCGILTGT